VTFSIGQIVLGTAECSTLLHPPALRGSGSLFDPEALNIARLLLMLDGDQYPATGITISTGLRDIADNWAPVDFGAADFAAELVRIIADIASIEGRTVAAPPTTADAFSHLDASLACAYSGAFRGTFSTL
jgi:hypothetical protein